MAFSCETLANRRGLFVLQLMASALEPLLTAAASHPSAYTAASGTRMSRGSRMSESRSGGSAIGAWGTLNDTFNQGPWCLLLRPPFPLRIEEMWRAKSFTESGNRNRLRLWGDTKGELRPAAISAPDLGVEVSGHQEKMLSDRKPLSTYWQSSSADFVAKFISSWFAM
eukprot:1148759-Pelagomonas_calceolata.AAC.4